MTNEEKINILNNTLQSNINKMHGYCGTTSNNDDVTIDFFGNCIVMCILNSLNYNILLNKLMKSKDIIILHTTSSNSNSDLGIQILFVNDLQNVDI